MKIKLSFLFLAIAVGVCVFIFKFSFFKSDEPERNEPVATELGQDDVTTFFDKQSWVNYQDQSIVFKVADTLKNKAVSIHLWASWCAPCLNEIPELIAYAKKNKNGVQFIVVSLDESSEALAKFLKSFPELNDALFIQIWDKSMIISKKFNADRLPMTIFVPKQKAKIKVLRSVVDWKSI